jgi:uncharacterized Zn-binding protein involved in type VI secretion
MAVGYFIRLGDKTTCGGLVIEANPKVMMYGMSHAREGDRVTCGMNGGTYVIVGGISHIKSHGRRVAGTLDSVSSCPCRAHLIHSQTTATYSVESASANAPARRTGSAPAGGFSRTSSNARDDRKPADEILEEEEEEEELEAGITLRLGLFFDGTGNNHANSEAAAGCYAVNLGMQPEMAEDIRQYCARFGYDGKGGVPDSSYGNDVTNVARLYELYPDQVGERLSTDAKEAYLKAYVQGIGTSSGEGDSFYGQGSGRGETGVVARVEQMPALVLDQLRLLQDNNSDLKISRIEIDLFGFSRGAAAARHCANDLLKEKDSLLARALPAGSPLLTADFAWRHRNDFSLNFIGLFDSVAGIVSLRDGDFSPHNKHNPGLNLRLAPDEYRHNFSLNQAEREIELPGCHSDIGGGYLPLALEKLLLSKPETSIEPDPLPDERSNAYGLARQRFGRESGQWLSYVPPEGLSIATWSVVTQRRVRDTVAEKRVYAAIASQRQVRGELSLVYLRIMREWGVRAGVAFQKIPDTQAFALPAELQPIAVKLQAFALGESFVPLTAEEHALLRRHYIHLSANWNAAKGWNNSDLDVLFINRPAEGKKRVEHPNE